MLSGEIRRKFLEFFASKGHQIVPSDSLVPKADPTLLFTSAGMNQFKEQFLGHNVTYRKAASSQKCLRTADLEKVGKTSSHHTFFEMLGNFSFGDYFKKEAIVWAWEFMTEVMGIEKERLWVSVYKEDGESYKIWRDIIKVPKEKIKKLGADENFWPANAPKDGPNGPCGPCSEIFYNRDDGTSVEVWNLVFTQFDRKEGGKLDPLPSKNIDTGMGLERITALMQGAKTNFETDLFVPIINEIKRYNSKLKAPDLSAIADHTRAVTFAICDGVAPSNEERGYVIRKLIRRACLRGGGKEPFLYNVVPKIAEVMKDAYPELIEKREEIVMIVKEEEERFLNTLSAAMPILQDGLRGAKDKILEGEKIFKLVDTYGLPLEVIEKEAGKRNVKADIKAFEKLMKERKELSRKGSKIEADIFALNLFVSAPEVSSSGELPLLAKVVLMVKGKKAVKEAREGDLVELMTEPASSAFYTEAGGQVGDKGIIRQGNGSCLEILNTVKVDNKVVHIAKVTKGSVKKGDAVELNLESEQKKNIARNHTATHLLHSALRSVLGEHVHQAGSLVAEDRLRFDFTHMKKLSDREIEKIEEIVNGYIQKGVHLAKEEKTLDEAKKEGAIALFGEKYADKVRVVTAGDFSKEVCGGTHVNNTKEIEFFKIIRESSVASGVRRIEAVTSQYAKRWIEEDKKRKAKSEKLEKEKEEKKKREKETLKEAGKNTDEIIKKGKAVGGVNVITETIEGANMGILRNLADRIKSKEKSLFLTLAGSEKNRVNIVLSITKDLVLRGLDASLIIKEIVKIVEGSGGGRPDFAQAGGKRPDKLAEAMKYAEKLAGEKIRGNKGRL